MYQILKPLVKLSLRAYFRQYTIIGVENIPKEGPLIFVSNHPSALIDPLVSAASLNRPVYFLAGANWFGKGLKERFLKRYLRMIPVYRPWLAKGEQVSNFEMFKACFEHLDKGECILLFPEASSVTVSTIRELKTGAIRIKMGFEEFAKGGKSAHIIPVGISYSDPHTFQSTVVVKIGEPIRFDDKIEGEENLLKRHTTQMQQALKENIINIEKEEDEDLVRKVNRLFIDTYLEENTSSHKDRKLKFQFAQGLAKAILYFEEKDETQFNEIKNRINVYFDSLASNGLKDENINNSDRIKPGIAKILFAIFGIPIAFCSLIVFTFPYQLTKFIYRKKFAERIRSEKDETIDDAFIGSIIFSLGAIIFMVWTLIVSITIGLLSGNLWFGVLTLFVLYPIFRLSLSYSIIALQLLRYYRGTRIRARNKNLIEQLTQNRVELINEIKRLEAEFLEET